MTVFTGTSGDDTLRGTADADVFNLEDGGKDKAVGGKGDDLFRLGGALGTSDQILGGEGFDTVSLDGDYSAGLSITRQMLTSIEQVMLGAGHDYDLTIANEVLNQGYLRSFTVDGSALGAGDDMRIDASAIDHGYVTLASGAGDDLLIGSSSQNVFFLNGGDDTAIGGADYDEFHVDGVFTAQDRIDGGAGLNVLFLNQAEAPIVLGGAVKDIDRIELHGHAHFDFVATNDALDGEGLLELFAYRKAGFNFDGSAETNGRFEISGSWQPDHLIGGERNDDLYGNHGVDTLQGGGGHDTLDGGAGNDWYIYTSVQDSTVEAPDFLRLEDRDIIDLSAIDADVTRDGDQKFRLVGAFNHHAGQLMLSFDGTYTHLLADVDGDGAADMEMTMWDDHTDFSHFKF
jgi:Ca2+-binding RTX toxin-like protein